MARSCVVPAGVARSTPTVSRVTPARHLWTIFEPLHAVTYFTAEGMEAFQTAGFRGFWRGYFAGRSAPLGLAPAAVTTALYGNFAPQMVERALPSIWDLASPGNGPGRAPQRLRRRADPAVR